MDVIDGLLVKKMSLLSPRSHLIKDELKIEFTSLFVSVNIDDMTLQNILAIFQKWIQHFLDFLSWIKPPSELGGQLTIKGQCC